MKKLLALERERFGGSGPMALGSCRFLIEALNAQARNGEVGEKKEEEARRLLEEGGNWLRCGEGGAEKWVGKKENEIQATWRWRGW